MSFSIPKTAQELAKARLVVKRLERKQRSEQRLELANKMVKFRNNHRNILKGDAIRMLTYLESTGVNLTDLQSASNRHFTLQ